MDLRNCSSGVSSVVECRAARGDEYATAAQLRQEMAREMGGDFDARFPGWRTRFCAFFSGKQATGTAQLFLAYDGERAVGCTTVSIAEDYRRYCFGTPAAHVNAVYVRPDYRRRGIARRLMQLAIEWARERGCTRVRLRASEDGRFLYEQLGFREGREMELDL